MKRRSFLKVVGGVTGACVLGVEKTGAAESIMASAPNAERAGNMPRRLLGKTGAWISVVGFPGLALVNYDQTRGTDALHSAFDRGINYFDVAPAYGNGECQTKMGIGMKGMDRDKIFLACKTKMRDKEGARKELENSLEQLKTGYFDLYQMHHLVSVAEVRKALGPGGAIETFIKAREEGKVKHFGFSAHTTRAAIEALTLYPQFETVMFPFNFVEYYLKDFGKPVIELASQKGAALISIKPMSHGAWPPGVESTRKWWYRPVEDKLELQMAWRFALSIKGMVAGIPPSWLDLLDMAMTAVKDLKPITEAEIAELKYIAKHGTSIFTREEESTAMNGAYRGCPYGWA